MSVLYCNHGFLPGLFYKIPQLTFLIDWIVQTHLSSKDFTQLATIDQYPMILLVAISTIMLSFLVDKIFTKQSGKNRIMIATKRLMYTSVI